jgi:hypothetical protein
MRPQSEDVLAAKLHAANLVEVLRGVDDPTIDDAKDGIRAQRP